MTEDSENIEFHDAKDDDIVSQEKFDYLSSEMKELKVTLSENQQIEKDINKSFKYKDIGNQYFREKQYHEAIENYSYAIEHCPLDDHENLAIFYGNRSACYALIDENDVALDDCNESLKYNPNYVKVLVRRAQILEKLDRVDDAVKDLKAIETIEPNFPKIQENISRVEKLAEIKMNKLKDEALGKLKELGNTILGNFGMSLDNFKMSQDPNTGSWSIGMK